MGQKHNICVCVLKKRIKNDALYSRWIALSEWQIIIYRRRYEPIFIIIGEDDTAPMRFTVIIVHVNDALDGIYRITDNERWFPAITEPYISAGRNIHCRLAVRGD